jgi:hypothetical protein
VLRRRVDVTRTRLVVKPSQRLSAGVDECHVFENRVSGSRDAWADLAKAPAFLRPGDCLVVWKLDRLDRSLSLPLTRVTDLKARGIAFRSFTKQMDTTPAQGELLFHFFGALAQFERSLTQERVRAGDVWVIGSRQYRAFEEQLISKQTLQDLRNTGTLGLSLSYDIVVKQHHGTLTVDSRAGEFTEFTVTLPCETSPPD